MVKEWLHWVAAGRKRRSPPQNKPGTGCMCAVFQLFDFPHHPFTYHEQGPDLVAPRNSLELVKEEVTEKDTSNFPVKINQIKTRASSETKPDDHGFSDSPGTAKTPGLVARLMGLDLLPEPGSSPSLSGPKANRFSDDDISVGARRRPALEHHRLSLQVSKERPSNAISPKSRGKSAKLRRDETKNFARELVSQVKERVMSRRVGLTDITNTGNYRGENEIIRRDQDLVLRKNNPRKKKCRGGNENISGVEKLQLGPRGSGKLLSNDDKKGKKVISNEVALPVRKDPSPPATKLPHKQVSDAIPSKRSAQLSRNPSRTYLQSDRIPIVLTDSDGAAAECGAYIRKILKRAGIDGGVSAPLALGKWRTPSHPLDPSIFYYVELFAGAGKFLGRRCNRKLVFHLADELLAEILKPYLDFDFNFENRVDFDKSNNFDLCDELCRRIGSFPAANCRVLEDIDSLIGGDFRKLKSGGGFEDEGGRLVTEIEGEIMESLLLETVAVVAGGSKAEEERRNTESRQVSRAREGRHVMRCY